MAMSAVETGKMHRPDQPILPLKGLRTVNYHYKFTCASCGKIRFAARRSTETCSAKCRKRKQREKKRAAVAAEQLAAAQNRKEKRRLADRERKRLARASAKKSREKKPKN